VSVSIYNYVFMLYMLLVVVQKMVFDHQKHLSGMMRSDTEVDVCVTMMSDRVTLTDE